jgi:four helix bundle protein
MSYGSAQEVRYQVSLAFRLGYLGECDHQSLGAACEQTSKTLGALIHALRQKRPEA